MNVEINGIIDVSDRVLDIGREDADFGKFVFTGATRTFRIADADGYLDPLGDGVMSSTGWKNQPIKVTDEFGETVFLGLVNKVQTLEDSSFGTVTVLTAYAVFTSILDFAIEENSKFETTVNTDFLKTSSVVRVNALPVNLSSPAVISFTQNLIPSYAIQSTDDNLNVNLDRGIELEVVDGQVAIISEGVVAAPTSFLKKAVQAALDLVGQGDKIDGDSFDELISSESSQGFNALVFVTAADKVSLVEFAKLFIDAFGLYLRNDEEGRISVVQGPEWTGYRPPVEITEDIIISLSDKSATDQNPHYYAYNALYADGDEIGLLQKVLNSGEIIESNYPKDPFNPFPLSNLASIAGNRVLYADETTARHYAEKFLNYYRQLRTRVTLTLSAYNEDGSRVNLKQFDEVLLTVSDLSYEFNREPGRIVNIDFDEKIGQYVEVIVELSNVGKTLPSL